MLERKDLIVLNCESGHVGNTQGITAWLQIWLDGVELGGRALLGKRVQFRSVLELERGKHQILGMISFSYNLISVD